MNMPDVDFKRRWRAGLAAVTPGQRRLVTRELLFLPFWAYSSFPQITLVLQRSIASALAYFFPPVVQQPLNR